MSIQPDSRARLWAVLALLLLGLWILHGFLVPLAWSVILALATWPLYSTFRAGFGQRADSVLPPLLTTLAFAALLLGPLTFALVQLGQELQSFVGILREAHANGLPPPDWLAQLPRVGGWAAQTWNHWLGSSESVRESLRHVLASDALDYTRHFAAMLLHRYVAVFFTLITLFFVYREGEAIGAKVLALVERALGADGGRYARHAALAVRATVNGIVLVALGQGVALGFGYAAVGLQHATLLGALTGMMAFIPFAAKIVALGASLALFAEGHGGLAIALMTYGLVVIVAADNYLRPKLIGGAMELPFLWTLLGILGGIETFGLLGLFLGPTVMAILISVWRDCFGESNAVAAMASPASVAGLERRPEA